MPVDISKRLGEIISILSFLRVLRSDLTKPGHSVGLFVILRFFGHGASRMATLGQLQSTYSLIRQEEQRYWSELTQLVQDLHTRLGIALGVNSSASELLAIGLVREDGQFVKASPTQLKRVGRELEFAVQVILSNQQSLVPPNVLVSRWSIKPTSAGIQLTNKAGGISAFGDIRDVAAHITDVFEQTLQSFSPYATN